MSALLQYNVQGLYVGSPSPYSPNFESAATLPIEGVQSAVVTLNYRRQEEFDWAGNGDPVLIERPRAELEFSYIFAEGINELNLGLIQLPNVSALANLNTERNYYLATDQVNQDLLGYGGTGAYVLAFGNGVITRYAFRATVGQPTTVTVNVEALNLLIQGSNSGQVIPPVYKQSGTYPTGRYSLPPFGAQISNYFEASPANIVLTFDSGSAIGTALSGANFCPLESFEFSIGLNREDVKAIGWAYPDARPMKWPIVIDIKAEALLNGYQMDALNRLGCPDSGWNFNVGFNSSCNTRDNFSFQFNYAKLDTESFNASIGTVNRVSFNWSLHIYDINRISGANFFITPPGLYYTSVVFPQVNYGTGAGQSPLVINLGTPSLLSILAGLAVLSGNNVIVSDDPGGTTVRVIASGNSADYQDISVSVS